MPSHDLIVIFMHGYSVTSFDTYGELPGRLFNEAKQKGVSLLTHDIFLAKYISFNDEVRLDDLSAAFETALKREIYPKYQGQRFICITHSAGGALVRNWIDLFYKDGAGCPISHLIMLSPPNHGSALAQLGKNRLGKLRSWFNGMETGQKILDWLELGSRGSWSLNKNHVLAEKKFIGNKLFFFVLTGQNIDRKLYDHLNSYTGEPGSDGVVRVASANINSAWVLLEQETPAPGDKGSAFKIVSYKTAWPVPLRVMTKKSHSNSDMGIMRSVKASPDDVQGKETVDTIFRCLAVNNEAQYSDLVSAFAEESAKVQEMSRVETDTTETGTRYYFHDKHSMVIFRLRDSEGHVVSDYDLLLTAGPDNDPDALPTGFFRDRQCNCKDKSTLTYFFNYDAMNGTPAIVNDEGTVIRSPKAGRRSLGITVVARPDKGLVHYLPAVLPASEDVFNKIIRPNSTTLVEIRLRRIVSDEVMGLVSYKDAGEIKNGAEDMGSFI
jgi:hypothetical protein